MPRHSWSYPLPTAATGGWVLTADGAGSCSWQANPGGGAGSDTTAIHDDTAGEIAAITEKATPVSGDWLVIEDSADSNNKKRVQIGNLPGGGGGGDFLDGGTPSTSYGAADGNLDLGAVT